MKRKVNFPEASRRNRGKSLQQKRLGDYTHVLMKP